MSSIGRIGAAKTSCLTILMPALGERVKFSFLLRDFNIDPINFLREIRGSIKLGIRHRGRRRIGHTHHGPIDEPHQMLKGAGDSQFLNVFEIAEGRPRAGLHLFDRLMHRSPSSRNGPHDKAEP